MSSNLIRSVCILPKQVTILSSLSIVAPRGVRGITQMHLIVAYNQVLFRCV
jgi:hypothetical protein